MEQTQMPPLLVKLPSGPIINIPMIAAIMRQGINEYVVFLASLPGFSFKIDGTDLDALAAMGVIAAIEVTPAAPKLAGA